METLAYNIGKRDALAGVMALVRSDGARAALTAVAQQLVDGDKEDCNVHAVWYLANHAGYTPPKQYKPGDLVTILPHPHSPIWSGVPCRLVEKNESTGQWKMENTCGDIHSVYFYEDDFTPTKQ